MQILIDATTHSRKYHTRAPLHGEVAFTLLQKKPSATGRVEKCATVYFCPRLRKMLTDFQNSSTVALGTKLLCNNAVT